MIPGETFSETMRLLQQSILSRAAEGRGICDCSGVGSEPPDLHERGAPVCVHGPHGSKTALVATYSEQWLRGWTPQDDVAFELANKVQGIE